MIIFTGSGRCGTVLLSKLFDTHHEYKAIQMSKKYFPPYGKTYDPFTRFSKRLEVIKDHFKDIDITSFRDSNNLYITFLDALYDIDPKIKIVLLVRDGRDFARSGISRGWYNESIYLYYGVAPDPKDPYFLKWPKMTPLERMAWLWNYRNRKALQRLKKVPKDNWMLVRLEDLTLDRFESKYQLEKIEDFLSLKANKKCLMTKYNAMDHYYYPPKEDWNEEMHIRFDKIAGDLMQRFGYISYNLKNRLNRNSTFYYNKALEYLKNKNIRKTKEFLLKTIKKEPKHYYARYHLASLLQQEKRYDSSLKEFDLTYEALKMTKSIPENIIGSIYFHKGEIFYTLNKYNEAKKEFLKCLNNYPQHRKAREYLADLS